MGLISIGGLGSGLDVTSIVDALVNAEKAPKQNSLDRLETDVTVSLTGLGGLRSSLDELRSAALDLSLTSSFDKRSVSISDTAFFNATASSSASAGKYNIEVQALAVGSVNETMVFTGGSTTTFGNGTLTFTVGTKTFDVAVAATDTLQQIRDNINAATGNDFVSTNLLNNVTVGPDTGSILTFNSTTTGTGNDLVISFVGDASLNNLASAPQTQAAADASILIDGLTATNSSNTFTDVIQGVTLNITKVHTPAGTTDSLTVALDTGSTKSLISSFVKVYNSFIDVVKQLGSADNTQPGLLVGDYTLRQVSSQIRNLFSSTVSSASGTFNSLSAIGITTTRDGHLEIDNTTLDSAISTDFSQFSGLFASTDGFATQLRDAISNYTDSNGVITSREKSLNAQLGQIADDRLTLSSRIDALRLRLTNQFATMDALVAQMNSTQSYLTQQFDALPGFSSSKKG